MKSHSLCFLTDCDALDGKMNAWVRTVLMFLLFAPAAMSAQEAAPWNPDANGDGCVTTSDLVSLLSVFSLCSDWGVVDCPDPPGFACGDTVFFDNYAYGTLLIGDQCWFSENLRTEGYSNGDAIPAGLTASQWTSTTAGASAVFGLGGGNCFEDSPTFDPCDDGAQALAVYGRLYNWYAVDDERGLCPAGWHVPTDEEWTQLEDQITSEGFDGTEGLALKTTSGWYQFGNGTDDFGFSAPPSGYRWSINGAFFVAGLGAQFWSSTPNGNNAWTRGLGANGDYISRDNWNQSYGLAVRCLSDDE